MNDDREGDAIEVTEGSEGGDRAGHALGLDAYRALYENSPDAVFFSVPDGRVLAANPAACKLLRMTETEICSRGRQGLADSTDERWGSLLIERERTGGVLGVARMIRGDGEIIEAEMSAKIFAGANGEKRTCTIVRDVSERVSMERKLLELSAQLRDLALNDQLTGLRNRRGFVEVSAQILELADRQQVPAHLLFLDVDNMKELNDQLGHSAGDAGLRAVARALAHALRRSDVVSRIGGDEFAGLTLGLHESERDAVERRIRTYLDATATVAAVGMPVKVSVGWATHTPGDGVTVDDLLASADRTMYLAKAAKQEER